MISRLAQQLGKHTDNTELVAALDAFADRALHEYNNARKWYKPLKKAMAAFSELHTAGYSGVPVDQLHDVMRMELYKASNLRNRTIFRRYIVSQVALAMRDHGMKPTASKKGLLEVLSRKILKACGEPDGGVHNHARLVVKAIKDSTR